jgi:hypothetical protein
VPKNLSNVEMATKTPTPTLPPEQPTITTYDISIHQTSSIENSQEPDVAVDQEQPTNSDTNLKPNINYL